MCTVSVVAAATTLPPLRLTRLAKWTAKRTQTFQPGTGEAFGLDWIELDWIVRIVKHTEKHYLGAVADIAQKQNINRFYGHWYISVYQLISITQCLCHDNRFGLSFFSIFLPRSVSVSLYFVPASVCHVYFMSALCQNRLNTQKPIRRAWTRTWYTVRLHTNSSMSTHWMLS